VPLQQLPLQATFDSLHNFSAIESGADAMRSHASSFGLTDEQWDDAKAELRDAIMDAAIERRMTWYGEVAPKITSVRSSSVMTH
jgi:hypothetical protein